MADWEVGFTVHREGLSFILTALRDLGQEGPLPTRQWLPVLPWLRRVARRSLGSWKCGGEGALFFPEQAPSWAAASLPAPETFLPQLRLLGSVAQPRPMA